MQYFEYYDLQNLKDIEARVSQLTNLKTYAMIIHDRDIKENGDIKKKHFHIVLTFKDTTTSQAVANTMKIEEQYVNKIRTTTKSAELYLIHKNNPEKYQYNPKDVIANFDYEEKYDGVEPMQQRKEIAFKIAEGVIKQYNLQDYVSVDEYAKNKIYYDRCFQYRLSKIGGVDRQMECIFITGGTGTGKTTLAKTLATDFGYNCYISSGGKNPLDNYAGQECIILDDLRDSNYKLSDFLKLTDNNTDSLVGCRFYNKSIRECKLLIVTSVKSIADFYYNATEEEKEPQKQLFRRFKVMIVLDNEFANYYNYDFETGTYIYDAKTINPVSVLYNKDVNRKFTQKFIDILGYDKIDEITEQLTLDKK